MCVCAYQSQKYEDSQIILSHLFIKDNLTICDNMLLMLSSLFMNIGKYSISLGCLDILLSANAKCFEAIWFKATIFKVLQRYSEAKDCLCSLLQIRKEHKMASELLQEINEMQFVGDKPARSIERETDIAEHDFLRKLGEIWQDYQPQELTSQIESKTQIISCSK